MIPLPDLTADELDALALDMALGPYLMRPRVQLMDRDHRILDDLSDRFVDGQVDCKLAGAIATRSAGITLFDPTRSIAIDGHDASQGALYYDKMVAAQVRFKGPRIGRWVDIPVFCGPLTASSRNGYNTEIQAQDKARLATGMVWDTWNFLAKADKIATIKDLLVRTGEDPARIQLPGLTSRLPHDVTLSGTDRAWTEVVSLTESMNRQPLCDGRGDFRMRRWPEDPSVVFTDGERGTILSHPQVTYDTHESGFNGVWVQGPHKKGGARIEAVRWLPRNHPQSPWELGRGDPLVPFRVAYVVTNSKVRTQDEADALAAKWLRRLIQQTVAVTADVMPNWLLEPGDVVAFRTAALGNVESQLAEFSLPLAPGASMSIGATKHLPAPRLQAKHRAKHRHHQRSRATTTTRSRSVRQEAIA